MHPLLGEKGLLFPSREFPRGPIQKRGGARFPSGGLRDRSADTRIATVDGRRRTRGARWPTRGISTPERRCASRDRRWTCPQQGSSMFERAASPPVRRCVLRNRPPGGTGAHFARRRTGSCSSESHLCRLAPREGQDDAKGRAFAELAVHFHPPLVSAHDPSEDRQPKTGSGCHVLRDLASMKRLEEHR